MCIRDRARGIQPEALRNFWIELGVTQKDISVPLATLFSHNTKMIDDEAPRLSFVRNPREVHLQGELPESVALPIHPNHLQKGSRRIVLQPPTVYIESEDANGTYRLKEFADIGLNGEIESIERSDKRPIIHWVSSATSSNAKLITPEQEEIRTIQGRIESNTYSVGTIVQLERIGYAIITEEGYLLMHE